VTYNGWTNEKKLQAFPLSLEESALIYYNSLPLDTKNNYELLSQTFTDRYNSEEKRWHMKSKLLSLQQTGDLTSYVSEFEKLAEVLEVGPRDKKDFFVSGLKTHLREALLPFIALDLPLFVTLRHPFFYIHSHLKFPLLGHVIPNIITQTVDVLPLHLTTLTVPLTPTHLPLFPTLNPTLTMTHIPTTLIITTTFCPPTSTKPLNNHFSPTPN